MIGTRSERGTGPIALPDFIAAVHRVEMNLRSILS
jgi:hypothetical protein